MGHHRGEHCAEMQDRSAPFTPEDVAQKVNGRGALRSKFLRSRQLIIRGRYATGKGCMVDFRLGCATNDETDFDKWRDPSGRAKTKRPYED